MRSKSGRFDRINPFCHHIYKDSICARLADTVPSGAPARPLALPHREVTSRRFVLAPLLELEPGLTLPDGVRLADALAALPDGQRDAVRRAGAPLL
ncbi:hypothetical protein Cwoe_2025 [Conexibacter woesei DSM 14684]|uniref:2-amino-4-hydroxy-6-hydroxymethyldihydropteridine pyrophosphokinase n=1 Tax=Conexibacter woesei (strain DSM 14684 / CCUG 47730 / CIP 108061 / JCM 11494 / NBRC 100937 / ID131577) TaxID=469383 RepID=D3F479_CONWI|nr:hypothetical protein Cwoe_2025 [Conexibacter woesei DSM 14684]